MLVERWLARLRAAHALSFAMTVGQRPAAADLEDGGLGGVDAALFEARRADLVTDRPEDPVLVAADETVARPVEPTFGLAGLSLAPGQAAD